MINKLRYQLLAILIFFSTIIIGLTILNFAYIKHKNKLEKIHLLVLKINSNILNNTITISNFFTYDTKNTEFFTSGNSSYLNKQHENINKIRKDVKILQNLDGFKSFNIVSKLNTIHSELDIYENDLNRIVELILRRGYKDHGTEGKMRNFIHELEAIKSLDLSTILMLRRHEKDYIIRNEKKYIIKLKELATSFENQIQTDPKLNENTRDSALYFLKNYISYFDLMIDLDRQIGIKDNTALRDKIHIQGNKIIEIFNHVSEETIQKKEDYFNRIRIYYIISLVLLIFLSIYLSFFISKRISINLSLLSSNISKFVSSGFNTNFGNDFPHKYPKDEVGLLIDNYLVLRSEIISFINDLQLKVEKRTEAITCQKERIEQQKEEIEAQRDELYQQNQLIEFQKQRTDQQNKDIISSIQYAKLIQEALMPSELKLNQIVKNYFVFYKPKDIISGDFYWAKRIHNQDFNITILAVADCTGHGVPGALMSMLGIAFLNEIVLKKDVKKASHILDKLREKIIESFQSHSNKMITNDGMDIGLVLIDHKTNKLHFTGANRPMYLVRNNELNLIEGDKMPIGKHGISKGTFKNHCMDIRKNDLIYLFSDGYADQFGGPKNKKFKRQNFRDLILNIHQEPLNIQRDIMETEFEKWRDNNRQTDDILVIGIRF